MNIKVIGHIPGKALIEWNDGVLRRGVIPDELVMGNQVDDSCISLAVPYGVDFEAGLQQYVSVVTPETLTNALHNYGIWTMDDVSANPAKVQSALMSLYGIDFQIIMRIAAEQSRR